MSAVAVLVLAGVAPGRASAALSWSGVLVDPASGLSGVSCPSVSLCVAVDGAGNVVTSTNPTGGAGAWTVTRVDGLFPLGGVSCPSASLCVAGDGAGNVLTSTNPTGGAGAWTVTKVDGSPPFNNLLGVSCASASLCVAGDGYGRVVTSTNPNGGAGAWTVAQVDPHSYWSQLWGVSCPSASLCVAVDGAGNVLASTNPTGGAGAWTTPVVGTSFPGRSAGVSCPSVALCVAVYGDGNARTSTNPAGGPSAWTATDIDGPPSPSSSSLSGVSCPSVSLCVAVDLEGKVVVGQPARSPANTLPPAVSGMASVGRVLSASRGSWTGTAPIRFTERWQRCRSSCVNIPGATSLSYRLVAADAGAKLRVAVTATNPFGHAFAYSTQLGPVAPSAAQVKTQLLKELTPSGKKAKIAALLKQGGYALSFKALTAGKAVIAWYYLPKGAHLAKGRPQPELVATAKHTFTKAGIAKITITLTSTGKQLLRNAARHLKLTAKGTFTPTGKTAIVATKTLKLTR